MSTENNYKTLYQLNTSTYKATSSWVLPNTFSPSFSKETKYKFMLDDVLKKVPFILDGQYPQYK